MTHVIDNLLYITERKKGKHSILLPVIIDLKITFYIVNIAYVLNLTVPIIISSICVQTTSFISLFCNTSIRINTISHIEA